jgi:hypothetical protein
MEPKLADETWGKLGGEIVPVPVVAPPEIAELLLFEAAWLFQLRLWLDLIEAWWAPGREGDLALEDTGFHAIRGGNERPSVAAV